MKIIKGIIFIVILGFIITLNVYAFVEPKASLHNIIYNWRFLFWGIEVLAFLSFTHIKCYTFAKKRIKSVAKDKKELDEALNILDKEGMQ